jgi:hypothetical protein
MPVHPFRIRLAQRALHASLAIVLACVVAPAHADWSFDATADATYDSNLSRAADPRDIHGDQAATVGVAARAFGAPSAFDFTSWSMEGGVERYARYHGLDNQWLGASAAWRRKLGMGLTAPWIQVGAIAQYRDYDVDLRTGPRVEVRVEAGRRFDAAISARAGVTYDARRSSHGEPKYASIAGDVFNLHGFGAHAGADYQVDGRLLIAASVAVRRGDVVSTASEGAHIYTGVTAVAEDPTFGDELYDYRLKGTTRTATLTASWALGDHASIDVGYTRYVTNAAGGLTYRGDIASLGFIYRY